MKTIYVANDGSKFDSLEEAKQYEKEQEEKQREREEKKKLKNARRIEVEAAYEKFIELEKKYLEDYGEWYYHKSWRSEDDAPAPGTLDWLKWIFE